MSEHVKVTCYLAPDQVNWLDRLATDIRESTGKPIKRSELMRGLLNAVKHSGVDLRHCSSEVSVTAVVMANLRKG